MSTSTTTPALPATPSTPTGRVVDTTTSDGPGKTHPLIAVGLGLVVGLILARWMRK